MIFKKSGPPEWLLVCLGNYGKQYENTRHNIGFMAAERLIVVTTRRDSWRSHVHRTHTAQRVQSFKL